MEQYRAKGRRNTFQVAFDGRQDAFQGVRALLWVTQWTQNRGRGLCQGSCRSCNTKESNLKLVSGDPHQLYTLASLSV